MVQIPGPRYSVAPRNQDDSDIILWESNGLVSDRLVFVHIPKTGYVTEHLKELLTCNVLWDIWYKIFLRTSLSLLVSACCGIVSGSLSRSSLIFQG